MAGEISPDMMFFGVSQNRSKSIAGGCRSVYMGAIGHMIMGGRKNKTKRAQNGRAGHVLICMHTATKIRMCAGMVMVARGNDYHEWEGKEEAHGTIWVVISIRRGGNEQRR